MEAFIDDCYKGSLEPRPDILSEDVVAVVVKIDSQRSYKNNSLEKARTIMTKQLSKKHNNLLVGSVDLVGDESVGRFRRLRRPLGGRIEDKVRE